MSPSGRRLRWLVALIALAETAWLAGFGLLVLILSSAHYSFEGESMSWWLTATWVAIVAVVVVVGVLSTIVLFRGSGWGRLTVRAAAFNVVLANVALAGYHILEVARGRSVEYGLRPLDLLVTAAAAGVVAGLAFRISRNADADKHPDLDTPAP